jgi:hypothetical protein
MSTSLVSTYLQMGQIFYGKINIKSIMLQQQVRTDITASTGEHRRIADASEKAWRSDIQTLN